MNECKCRSDEIPYSTMKVFTSRFWLAPIFLIGVILFNGIAAQAASATITAGQAVNLDATADGSAPFTYQWYKDGSILTGATASTYVITSFQAANAGTYFAVVSNPYGSTTSDNAVLTLSSVVNTPPAFTTQPVSQTVTAGGSVTFIAAANGTPTPTFQWKKGGVNITGATSASYTIASTVTGDAGSYTVVATNSVNAVASNIATLTVNAATSAPAFTTQPVSQTVTAGGSVTFTATASGSPAPTFQWRKGGVSISGATTASYTIASTVTGDAGSYTVVATNSVNAVASNIATLAVNAATSAPVITTQPVSQTLVSSSTATFTVVAGGTPAPTYQWKKGGTNISGATGATYTQTNITTSSAGTYTAVVTNSAGSVTSNGAVLTVNTAPAFTTHPANQTVTAGGSVTFTSVASGAPAPTYQWKKGGVNIAGATGASYTIATAVAGDAASYTAVATNSVSAVTSNAATLTVNATPAFTTQPASQTVTTGNAVTFTAAASGTPTPTFQWKKGGVNITGATNASYTIQGATTGDAGSYTVVATNSVSAVTSNIATLTVNAVTVAPAFTTQPASQTVIAGGVGGSGGSIAFTAAASGSPAPTFQWRKNGVNISGATGASYTIASPTGADAGSYTVVATNSASSVTSNTATLTVIVAPSSVVIAIAVE